MDPRPWHRHYDEGVPRALDYEALTVPDLLERTASRFSDRRAIRFLNGLLTWRELADHADRLGRALADLGVEPGDAVAVHLPNMPQTVVATYAVLGLGARVVLTNPLYTTPELHHQWEDAGCRVAITADFLYKQRIRDHRKDLAPETWVVASLTEYLRPPLRLVAPLALLREDPPKWALTPDDAGVHRFRDLVDRQSPTPPRPTIDPDDVALLQYTGGTTGRPKGAVLTHRNLTCNVQQLAAWFPDARPGEEVVLGALPLFHVFGMTVCMNWPVHVGATMALVPDPRDLDRILDTLEKEAVTLLPGVPALFQGLADHEDVSDTDFSALRSCFSGSAPLPADVLERFESRTGATIVEGFGLTETSPVTHANPLHGLRKPGKVGVPVPDTDARLVQPDEPDRDVEPGEPGELLVRGPQVMQRYWNRPEETEETLLPGGWLRTGDLATMDEDGYFEIVGREKDMIVASGYNVYPDEVDEALSAHEDVAESATIGVPDEKRGETVKSFVVLREGAGADAKSLEAWCRERLAAYKVPREIEFIDELPRSPVMKVLRRELREREIERREQDAGGPG